MHFKIRQVEKPPPIKGKYDRTIQEILMSEGKTFHIQAKDMDPKVAYLGFKRVIKNKYNAEVSVFRTDGEIYIEKI